MKNLLSLLALVGIALTSQAQSTSGGKITGNIKDGGIQKVIDAATVSLLKAKDSSLVKVAVADKDGNFAFENVKEGSYLVLATSVGHGKTYSNSIAINASTQNQQIGTLQLVQASQNLKEVTVTSKKQFVERKADKTIVNVDAMISNTGTTALEVLEKSPGVTVDKDGNISLKGKQGVQIFIDGKPTYLSAQEVSTMLRNMPSNGLDQIEIMTNPSAKYDAAGRSGIINIKTKKNKQKGFNGNVSTAYGQGFYPKTNNSLSLNYKAGKVNMFSNFGASYRENFQNIDIARRFLNTDKSTRAIFEQESRENRRNSYYNAKIGADFYLTQKTTIGLVATASTAPRKEKLYNVSNLKSGTGILDSIVTANNTENSTWKNLGLNANFRHIFDSTGTELTADVDYVKYDANKDQYFLNQSYTPSWLKQGFDESVGELPSDINIYSAKIDFSKTIKKGLKFETGVKSSYVNTKNNAGYYLLQSGIKVVDYNRTNQFNYKENINAAYVNLNKEWKKWSVQTGLRLENTNVDGLQFGNPMRDDSSFTRSYTNLFPTVYVGYNPSEKNQFAASIGRRINRPDYEDMNPFLFYIDKYTYGEGNPFLKPMYTNTLELSHTYKQFLTTTLNLSRSKDLFGETFDERNNAIIIKKSNFGVMNDVSLAVSAQVPVKKWWMAQIYTEGRYNQYKGFINDENVNIEASTFLVNITNQFTFKKGWSAELSGFYRTKGLEGQIQIKGLGQATGAVQKQVLKNKGTLKLSVRDMFNTMRPKGNIDFKDTKVTFTQRQDNQVATISFTYRFGKPIKGIQKRKTGGAGEEQNRVKGGN
ncbi:MAG: TonB-dependent receptor [Ferruginibacter sp.]|nr:TonB-dependent receptor [Ferruginibacter sp.]